MFYDPRISMGMMFTLIGTILTGFGLSTRSSIDMYSKSMGIDANLWWGLVLLFFGIVTLTLGRRAQAKLEEANPTAIAKSEKGPARRKLKS